MLKGNGVLGEDEVAQLCVRVRVCAHEEQADLTLTSCETDLLRQGGGSHEAVGLSSFAYVCCASKEKVRQTGSSWRECSSATERPHDRKGKTERNRGSGIDTSGTE